MEKDSLIKRLHSAAKLSRALVEREAVRSRVPDSMTAGVVARLQANRDVLIAARALLDTTPTPDRHATHRKREPA